MIDSIVQVAAISALSGLLTLIVTAGLRRWRTPHERLAHAAEVANTDADTDHKTMDALTSAFRAIAERQSGDINDLRERLRRVEDALLLSQQRNDALSAVNDTLSIENAALRDDVTRLRGERDHSRERAEQVEGELRQLKQVAVSSARVYGQDGKELEPEET